MTRRYFGTDGIRGQVGTSPITPEFVLHLGWAVGHVLAGHGGRGKVVIGKDTRLSGYMFESALQAGLSAAGVDIRLLGPMPTPGIAYLTRTMRADAGIVISASHNPYHDNGIKFFSRLGFKLPDETEREIERFLDHPVSCVESGKLGRAVRVNDAAGRYIEFCKSTVPPGLELGGMRLVVDCANGATYDVAPKVFRELGADVISIGADPDGVNINFECGSTSPATLQRAVIEHDAELGIALDGDGDRLIMVDHKGEVVDGDELLFVIARDRQSNGHRNGGAYGGGVVGTVMSNLGLELAFKDAGIPFRRAAVGDRYVSELMTQEGWILGGESSGHIICRDCTTTGDGIISALQVLSAMVNSGQTLYTLKRGMTKFPQTMINVRLEKRFLPEESELVQNAVRDVESQMAGRGRVLLRPSGTEPVIRVMVEGDDAPQVETLAKQLAEIVAQAAEAAEGG
ncbi:MAG TPA: phosphoglucosamine mutase [Gammaproteobacteria bacterium]|nr:phosphoglucosamine mutase [Gammaproteobacteria bacterium]